MRTATYRQAYDQWLAYCGLDDGSQPEAFLKSRFNAYFNDRLRTIWRAARWPFLQKCTALAVCKFGILAVADDSEIDLSDAFGLWDKNPVLGWSRRIVPRLRSNSLVGVGENLVSKPQARERSDGQTLSVGDCFAQNGEVFAVAEQSVFIGLTGNLFHEDFIFSEEVPELNCGDCFVVSEDGELKCYCVKAAAPIMGGDIADIKTKSCVLLNSIPFQKTVWLDYLPTNPTFAQTDLDKTFPFAFKAYIVEGARASWVAAQNRQEEREIVERPAKDILEEEILRLEQSNSSAYGNC